MSMSPPFEILFEDNHVLAVVKPAPLLTQGRWTPDLADGVPSLEGWVKTYLKDRYHKAGNVYLGIPHRLDRPVSGIIVFARNTKSARKLAEQFQQHQVVKHYWAIVEGHVHEQQGTWEDWIRKVPDQARAEATTADAPSARKAVTSYRVLAATEQETLLELQPQTGRMHQLRLQAALRGHPIRGDSLYGSAQTFGPPADIPRDRVIALHARELCLRHPIWYRPLGWAAALPGYWKDISVPLPAEAFISSSSDPEQQSSRSG